jgi:hypothetical protein
VTSTYCVISEQPSKYFLENTMSKKIILLLILLLAGAACVTCADRLPKQVPENQIFSIDTFISAIGITSEESTVDWTLDYQNISTGTYGTIHDGRLNQSESIALLNWQDNLRSSGGSISLSKKIDFDSKNRGKSSQNLKTEKVLSYVSQEGSHLMGSENWMLDVAGNWEWTADDIRCVFAEAETEYLPAFCNVVKAKSELVNINTGQISAKGAARSVASSASTPATLNYLIAVTPLSNTTPAMGTVKTTFGGSIMEARGQSNNVSATNDWKDSASVTGGITQFQKKLLYDSGIKV